MTMHMEASVMVPLSFETQSRKVPPGGLATKTTPTSELTTSESSWNDYATPVTWKNPTVTRLGQYYPLEHSHVRVSADLEHVVTRLQVALSQLSLHVTQLHESPVRAECISMEHVQMVVSVFGAREDRTQLIVEVQRRRGDSLVFGRYARAILQALQQETSSSKMTEQVPFLLCHSLSAELCRRLDQEVGFDRIPVNEHDALVSALTLLEKDRIDCRMLALESLCVLTDCQKTIPTVCHATAQAVLMGTYRGVADEVCQRLQHHILGLAVTAHWWDSHTSRTTVEEASFMAHPAYLALTVVANAMQLVEQERADIEPCTGAVRALTGVDLVSFLVMGCVNEARDRPHVAYQALLALHSLCNLRPATRKEINHNVIQRAHHVGQASHSALGHASERLLVTLQA